MYSTETHFWELKFIAPQISTEAEFLDEILAIHSHLYSFALSFLFLQTRAISTVQLPYTVKEKGGKPENHTPFQMV